MFKQYEDLFRQMEREMERMSHDAFRQLDRGQSRSRIWQPRVDVCETPEAVLVTVELAGLSADAISRQVDVTLSLDGRTLVISGRRDEPECQRDRIRCHQLEIYYGDFARAISLPHDIGIDRNRLTATYRDGFLTVRLPKRPLEDVRNIPIGHGK